MKQINDVKLRKNEREDELIDQLDAVCFSFDQYLIYKLRQQISKYSASGAEEEEEEKGLPWSNPLTTAAVSGVSLSSCHPNNFMQAPNYQ